MGSSWGNRARRRYRNLCTIPELLCNARKLTRRVKFLFFTQISDRNENKLPNMKIHSTAKPRSHTLHHLPSHAPICGEWIIRIANRRAAIRTDVVPLEENKVSTHVVWKFHKKTIHNTTDGDTCRGNVSSKVGRRDHCAFRVVFVLRCTI
jgi:hypothetical protein